MEEDIKILEKLIEDGKEDFTDTKLANYEIQALEHLIARNKELEDKYNYLYQDSMKQWEERCRMAIELDNEVIPKSKVREILEKIENRNYNDYTQKQDGNEVKYEILRDIQELLED